MTGLLQRIEQNIHDRQLLKRGQKILAAVSGGLDSMALLRALQTISTRRKWRIVVAHFNHQLRGRAGDADELLVRKIAAEMKLPIVVERADVKSFSKKSRLSLEMAARKLRHDFFARAAVGQKIKTIALAHHADDQVELFFLRMLRGAGGEGLAGMKWRSPSPANSKIEIIRPLLNLAKTGLREFARENKIRFRDDATNFSNDFLRNRVRNELLPLLRRNYQPALTKTVLRLMEIVRAESEFAGEAARQFRGRRGDGSQAKIGNLKSQIGNKLETRHLVSHDFDKLPVAIQRRVLQMQLTEAGIAADFDLIESLRPRPNQFISAGANISVARDESGKIHLRTETESRFNPDEVAVNLSGKSGTVHFGKKKFAWHFSAKKSDSFKKTSAVEFFDADKIGGKIILRHWRAGDRFQPIGLKSPAKLQDLFINQKIPRGRRRGLVLAATAAGEIFWVEGLRISERFKLSPQTKRRLAWKWPRPDSALP